MEDNRFALRLAELLKRRRMTQRDLADEAGITASAVSRYVNGSREPHLSALIAICEALGTTPNELLGFGVVDAHYAERRGARPYRPGGA